MDYRKSEEEWRSILSDIEFYMLRQKGTEFPGIGEYCNLFEEGTYKCAGCGAPLYDSSAKVVKPRRWPTFREALPNSVQEILTTYNGRTKMRIACASCDGHLGYFFEKGLHSVNCISLKFEPANLSTAFRELSIAQGRASQLVRHSGKSPF